MNNRQRNIILISLFGIILVGLLVVSQLLNVTAIFQDRTSPLDYTRTYIISQNQTVQVRIYQTQTASFASFDGGFQYTITPTATPTFSVRNSNCVFNWAHQDLPEIAKAAQLAFGAVGSKTIQVIRADAYGENCYMADGSVSYFAAMTTDFYLSARVGDLNNMDALAGLVKTAYITLSTQIDLPARLGYLDITFTVGSQSKRFRTMFDQLKPLIQAGKSNADLLRAGGL